MITTHVLDTAVGRPARDVGVELERRAADGTWEPLARGVTDADGRNRELTPPGPVAAGDYRLRFATGAYFAAAGQAGFFPIVEIHFTVVDGAAHYHVPLLLSPFGYSTYRGS
jgi:5-hydroxyisourate hydrolase